MKLLPAELSGKINHQMTPKEIYRVIDGEYKIGTVPAHLELDDGEAFTWADLRDSLKVPAYALGGCVFTGLTMGAMPLAAAIFGSLTLTGLHATRPMRDGYLLAPPVSDEVDESMFEAEAVVPEYVVGAQQLAEALLAYGIRCNEYDEDGNRVSGCDIFLENLEDGGARIDVYEVKARAGFKISIIEKLGDDFARDLGLPEDTQVSVDSNIGGGLAALYVPKQKSHDVETMKMIRDIDCSDYSIPALVGESSTGQPLVVDIAAGVHWKVCGTTGSGKSVQIMNMVLSAMYHMPKSMLEVTAIDMKKTDLTMLDGFLHMTGDAITDPYEALDAMKLIRAEMDIRLNKFKRSGVRNVGAYNEKHPNKPMPFKILVIEELLLLLGAKDPIYDEKSKGEPKQISTVGKEVEAMMVHFSVASRASGIHMIYGIQRPDSKSIDGQILSNTPSSIGMKTTTAEGSRMIIGDGRCKSLLGGGDCYVKLSGGKAIRAQSAFATDDDIAMIGAAIHQKWSRPTLEAA